MSDITKKKRARGGHRVHAKKVSEKVNESIDGYDGTDEEVKRRLMQNKCSLKEKLETLQQFDKEILELLCDDETTDLDIEVEVEEAACFRERIQETIARLEMTINRQFETGSVQSSKSTKQSFRVKLPTLEVKRFSGKIHEWQEFWDAFSSAIHKNDELSAVDKFSYLRGLLVEPAKSAIAGFSLTDANYSAAVELLERRFGKKTAIQRAHINKMLNVMPVVDAKDIGRLRSLFDTVESHYRGLRALGVDESSYAAIVVPVILQKLPENIRLTITRGNDYLEWTVEEMLEHLLKEVELREEQTLTPEVQIPSEEKKHGDRRRTASALLTNKEDNTCAFCRGDHKHEDCRRITSMAERKAIIRKYGRCFNCLRKGHRARECTRKVKCEKCEGDHHPSMCEIENKKERLVNNNSSNISHNLHVGMDRLLLQKSERKELDLLH